MTDTDRQVLLLIRVLGSTGIKIPIDFKLSKVVAKILKDPRSALCGVVEPAHAVLVVLRHTPQGLTEVGEFKNEMLNWRLSAANLQEGDIVHMTKPLPATWHLGEDDQGNVSDFCQQGYVCCIQCAHSSCRRS